MTGVSQTAYWAAGVRRQDASGNDSICNDDYAHLFMDADGERVYEAAKELERPAVSLLVRHRLMSDVVQREVEDDAQKLIVLIGAGFDSRAFRVRRGRWLEVDTPAIIDKKNDCLPTSDCEAPLERIAIDLQTDSLARRLEAHATRDPVLVVVEGVLMYLREPEVEALLADLGSLFPRHRLLCDLMSKLFLERYTKDLSQVFTRMGAPFRWMSPAPERFVEAAGYRLLERQSVVGSAHRLGVIKMPPRFIRSIFLRGLFEGSNVCLFETRGTVGA